MTTRAQMAPHDRETHATAFDHVSLRLWLRLLACTTLIENHVRGQLRASFDTTLPRFDLMAQLERNPAGLKMRELSQRMMVTGGNITAITDQLEREGLVERIASPDDRRVWKVRLTQAGRESFAAMAGAHETWVVALMNGMTEREQTQLFALLGKLKQGAREAMDVA